MARGREGMAKRARERQRQERQEAKRFKRETEAEEPTEQVDPPDEAALMEEFRLLSERHAAGQVSVDDYNEERKRIFVELGLESED
jgi:hypothetical protein